MKKYVFLGLIILGLIVAAFFTGRATTPEKEVIVYRDKIIDVVKNVDKTETIKPDGTKIIKTVSTTSKKTEVKEEIKAKPVEKDWHLSLLMNPEKQYGLLIEKKLLGEISVGIAGFTNNTYFLTVGISF